MLKKLLPLVVLMAMSAEVFAQTQRHVEPGYTYTSVNNVNTWFDVTGHFRVVAAPLVTSTSGKSFDCLYRSDNDMAGCIAADWSTGATKILSLSGLTVAILAGTSTTGLVASATMTTQGVSVRAVPYVWPTVQGSALTHFTNDGVGNLTWTRDCSYNTIPQFTCQSAAGATTDAMVESDFPYNSSIGHAALHSVDRTMGYDNTAIGYNTLFSLVSGYANTAVGTNALDTLIGAVNGYGNTAIGDSAMLSATEGYSNTAVGFDALQNLTTGYQNAASGQLAGNHITTGFQNSAFGYNALNSVSTGQANVGIGYNAGSNITTSSGNIAIGSGANITGNPTSAIAIGTNASASGSGAVAIGASVSTASGTNCVALGPGAGCTHTDQVNIASPSSAYQVGIGIDNGSNTDKVWIFGDLRLGTSGTNGCLKGFGGATLTGSCVSDARLKTNIRPMTKVLSKLMQIPAVTFNWKQSGIPYGYGFDDKQNIGVIAQDVERQFPNLMGTDERGYKTVNSSYLPYILLEAVRELQDEITELRKRK